MSILNSLIGNPADAVAVVANAAADKIGGTLENAGQDLGFKAFGGESNAFRGLFGSMIGGVVANAAVDALKGGISNALGGLVGGVSDAVKQASTADTLRDYQHASKTFVSNNLARSPKMGSLYHVFFDVNPTVAAKIGFKPALITDTGMMVKSVTLPNFQIDTRTLNAYNRPNVIQTKIKYDPATIVFHDDMTNMVRDFWLGYYAYYYGDASHKDSIYNAPHKYNVRQTADWGYKSTSVAPLLNSIKIYQLHKRRFSLITLKNPLIKSWQHGTMVSGSNEPVDHTMSIEFESVTYNQGEVTSNAVSGFGMPAHYDKTPSPISGKGGGNKSLGGLLDSGGSILGDIASGNIGGALMTGMKVAGTFGGANIGEMVQSELKTAATNVALGAITTGISKFTFPGAPKT